MEANQEEIEQKKMKWANDKSKMKLCFARLSPSNGTELSNERNKTKKKEDYLELRAEKSEIGESRTS